MQLQGNVKDHHLCAHIVNGLQNDFLAWLLWFYMRVQISNNHGTRCCWSSINLWWVPVHVQGSLCPRLHQLFLYGHTYTGEADLLLVLWAVQRQNQSCGGSGGRSVFSGGLHHGHRHLRLGADHELDKQGGQLWQVSAVWRYNILLETSSRISGK